VPFRRAHARLEHALRRQSSPTSSSDDQMPTSSPAMYAAPRPVVSVLVGRRTGMPAKSACICINRLFCDAPPSTRSSVMGSGSDSFMTSMSSALESAMASRAALAMCAFVVPRVIPMIAPRAWGSHSGAPSPVNAGTTATPPLSGTEAASGSISAEWLMTPISSLSHCTSARR